MAEQPISDGLDDLDYQILFSLALGKSQSEAGASACTRDYPRGVSDRTVRNRMARRPDEYDRIMRLWSVLARRREEEITEISKQEYREKLAKLRAKGLRVKERALDQALNRENDAEFLALGVRVADSMEDRDLGKPGQVVKFEGGLDVNHRLTWNPQTVRSLAEQEVDMLNSQRLLGALPADVVEADIVETEAV